MGGKAGLGKKPELAVSQESIEHYERLIATCKGAERKGKTTPYTSRNGHMFSFLSKDSALNLRLPTDKREAFLKKHKTVLSVQYGSVMKEYVVVPMSLLARPRALTADFAASWSYIGTLKPK